MQSAETVKENTTNDSAYIAETVVYELGYHIIPATQDGDVESVVARLRASIEKAEGVFVSEGAPQKVMLAYPMAVWNNGKWTKYSEAHFGWIKFELSPNHINEIDTLCKEDKEVLRFLIHKTVREDTRVNVRQFVLKEVKRTDTIKSNINKPEVSEAKEEVSEEKLEKAIEELVTE
jgi:ribosomal protein S6